MTPTPRKHILVAAGALLLLFVLVRQEVESALLALLFLGIIPGTSISLPAWVMLVGAIVIGYAALRWLRDQPLYIGSHAEQEKLARQLARRKVLAMTAQPAAVVPVRPKRINAVNRRRVAKAKV